MTDEELHEFLLLVTQYMEENDSRTELEDQIKAKLAELGYY